MPRKDPLRKTDVSNNRDIGERKYPLNFFRNLFISNNQQSETLIPDDLLEKIYPVWDRIIVPALASSFGNVDTLYAIFYRMNNSKDEIILEIWDPDYFDIKPSQTFELNVSLDIAKQLPINRVNAKVISLKNWY